MARSKKAVRRAGTIGGRTAAGVALVLACVLLAYIPAMSAGWIWDDDFYVTANDTLRSSQGLADIWTRTSATPQYYPAVHTSFWIEYQLFGPNPVPFHVDNILLHAANALLLVAVLTQLRVPGAWIAGLLFAVHPVEVESVAWVTERKNCLSALFYLAALLLWLRRRRPGDADAGARPAGVSLAVFMLFVLALCSKTVTATLPAVMLVIVWWKEGSLTRRDLVGVAPLFAAGVGFGLVTLRLEHAQVGASGSYWDLTAVERVLAAGRAVWFYVGKTLAPIHLSFIYPRVVPRAADPWAWLAPAAVVFMLGLAWASRARFGRGPLAAVLIYVGTLFPALGFFNVYPMRYSLVADHFQYLASAVFLAGVGAALAALGPRAQMPVAAVLLVALGIATFRQCRIYHDEHALWTATLEKNPSAAIAHNNVGVFHLNEGRYAEAEGYLRRAVELDPQDRQAWANLGNALHGLHRDQESVECLRQAIGLKPDFFPTHHDLGNVLLGLGDFAGAAASFQAVLRLAPRYALSRAALIVSLREQGRTAEAAAECEVAKTYAREDAEYARELQRLPDVCAEGRPRP